VALQLNRKPCPHTWVDTGSVVGPVGLHCFVEVAALADPPCLVEEVVSAAFQCSVEEAGLAGSPRFVEEAGSAGLTAAVELLLVEQN
jgi:hypothetical protein